MVIFYNVRDPSMRPWHRPSMYTNTPELQATRIYELLIMTGAPRGPSAG